MIRRLLQAIFAISLVALIAGCQPARFVYVVGTHQFEAQGQVRNPAVVSGFDINATTGALTTISGSPWTAGMGPYLLAAAVTPSGQFLYVSNFLLEDVWGYSIDANTGALTSIPGSPFHFPAGISGPSGVAVDSSSSFLYVTGAAASGAAVAGYTIDSTTGGLTPMAGSPFGSGFKSPGAITANGNFVYVTDLDNDTVSAFAINTNTGALTQISAGPSPTGVGPYSIAIDPVNNGFVYVTNLDDGTVSAYSINGSTGALTSVPGSPFNVGSQPSSVAVAIEVQLDSAGFPIDVNSFLYVANAGNVSGFSVNSNTGALTPIAGSPFTAGTNPASVTVDPAGKFAYVANTGEEYAGSTGSVSGFSIDATTGALTPIAGSPWPVNDNPYAIVTTAGP
jgi:6-phosphogluconolactonase